MNKIKSYMLFLILLTMLSPATFGMAQTIIVKDSITHVGNDTGGYTDENGAIAIPNEAAQIRLSHICYETKSISKITADLQTFFLVPKSINLDEVAISAKALKRTKTTEVGSMKAKTQTKHKGANGFEMANAIHSFHIGKSRLLHPLAGIHGNQDTHLCHSPL